MNWKVKGTADGERFEAVYPAKTKGEARWKARRDKTPGKPLAKLEATPPNYEREREEIAAGLRDKPLTKDERAEYERLVGYVRIETVEAK